MFFTCLTTHRMFSCLVCADKQYNVLKVMAKQAPPDQSYCTLRDEAQEKAESQTEPASTSDVEEKRTCMGFPRLLACFQCPKMRALNAQALSCCIHKGGVQSPHPVSLPHQAEDNCRHRRGERDSRGSQRRETELWGYRYSGGQPPEQHIEDRLPTGHKVKISELKFVLLSQG